jgi:hypothetical protein
MGGEDVVRRWLAAADAVPRVVVSMTTAPSRCATTTHFPAWGLMLTHISLEPASVNRSPISGTTVMTPSISIVA